jgi:AcrR family transcriptional regulator
VTAALQRIITKRSLDCRPGAGRAPRSTRVPNWPDNGGVTTPSPDNQTPRTPGSSQRQHILSVALSLMAQSGVDGTSMRDLATATGLNVASLYHYFPSKRDLLVAVLDVHGMVDNLAAAVPPSLAQDTALGLAELLTDILTSMLEVEDFIRLMLGEVMRGDETAHAVGVELFAATQDSLERWLTETEPSICEPASRPAMARMLRAMVVGVTAGHGPDAPGHGGGNVLRAHRRRAQRTG